MTAACAFIGDCIALGLSVAHPGCDTDAAVRRRPPAIAHHGLKGYHQWVVISSGSNNAGPMVDDLTTLRTKVHAGRVIWILPANATNASQVKQVAYHFHDRVVKLTQLRRDHAHPQSYQSLWQRVSILI